jgi:hypothetical protein
MHEATVNRSSPFRLFPTYRFSTPVSTVRQMTRDRERSKVGAYVPTVIFKQKEKKMDMWLVLYWGGPIGLGAFFAGLGVLFMGIAKVRQGEKK